MNWALLVIDVQNDFCEGGVLPAKDTLSLIQPLNNFLNRAISHDILCIFTRDWHPPNHYSFDAQGGPWPVHCVQNSDGAQFPNGLIIPHSARIIDIEKNNIHNNMTYSAFENTDLNQLLENLKIINLIATGISTEYCVKATVLDALHHGFKICVLTDLIRSINVQPNDSDKALEEMKSAGATLLTSKDWYKYPGF
jgi:nicotinamidase/pyrazinamidase